MLTLCTLILYTDSVFLLTVSVTFSSALCFLLTVSFITLTPLVAKLFTSSPLPFTLCTSVRSKRFTQLHTLHCAPLTLTFYTLSSSHSTLCLSHSVLTFFTLSSHSEPFTPCTTLETLHTTTYTSLCLLWCLYLAALFSSFVHSRSALCILIDFALFPLYSAHSKLDVNLTGALLCLKSMHQLTVVPRPLNHAVSSTS